MLNSLYCCLLLLLFFHFSYFLAHCRDVSELGRAAWAGHRPKKKIKPHFLRIKIVQRRIDHAMRLVQAGLSSSQLIPRNQGNNNIKTRIEMASPKFSFIVVTPKEFENCRKASDGAATTVSLPVTGAECRPGVLSRWGQVRPALGGKNRLSQSAPAGRAQPTQHTLQFVHRCCNVTHLCFDLIQPDSRLAENHRFCHTGVLPGVGYCSSFPSSTRNSQFLSFLSQKFEFR